MTGDLVMHIGKETLRTALLLAAPVLIVTVVVGFVTAMLQAVTSIRDMTLGMVMKIASVGITLLIFGGWMLQVAMKFTINIFDQMQAIAR